MRFKCHNCGHEYDVDVNSRAYHRNAVACPKCQGKVKLSGAGKPTADTDSLLKYRYRSR